MSDTNTAYVPLLADGTVTKQLIRSGSGARPETGWHVGGKLTLRYYQYYVMHHRAVRIVIGWGDPK